jgi:uncharacterized membrane protein YtjA (UPF0391 family)
VGQWWNRSTHLRAELVDFANGSVGTGRHVLCSIHGQEGMMLFTIAVILLVLWLLGLVSGYTLGNFIYVLLVIALVLFVVGLVSGRRTV